MGWWYGMEDMGTETAPLRCYRVPESAIALSISAQLRPCALQFWGRIVHMYAHAHASSTRTTNHEAPQMVASMRHGQRWVQTPTVPFPARTQPFGPSLRRGLGGGTETRPRP